jgi:hypothetical protein
VLKLLVPQATVLPHNQSTNMQVLAVLAARIVGVDVTAAHLAAVRLMQEEGRQGGRHSWGGEKFT